VRAIFLHGVLDVVLAAQDRLEDHIVGARPEEIHVDTDLLKMPTECSQGPLVSEIILFAIFILDELVVLLVDGVVGEVHVLVVLVDLRGVGLTGKSGQALLKYVHSQWLVACNQHIDS